MVHFRTWFITFILYWLYPNFFFITCKVWNRKQRFSVSDSNILRGTPFRFFFSFQDSLKAWLTYFTTFSQEFFILSMPLRFSQIPFQPIVKLYQFSLGQHYRYCSSLLSSSQHLKKRPVAWNCALRLVHFHLRHFGFQLVVSDLVNNVTWRKWKPWYSCDRRSCLSRTSILLSSNETSFWWHIRKFWSE